MTKPNPKLWAKQYTEACIARISNNCEKVEHYAEVYVTKVRFYSEKITQILALTKDQFFPMWVHSALEDVIECGDVVLEEFKLTPPMQGLVLHQWLLHDEITRYKEKFNRTKDDGFSSVIIRLETRIKIVEQLFLRELRKSEESKKRLLLFLHRETSIHIGHDWTLHIIGPSDVFNNR